MKRGGSAVPRYVPLPIAVIIAVMVTGAATVQPAGAQILVVSATGRDCHGNRPVHTSVQGAVNAALPGSTILVCPGTYAEQVVVTKNDLTIRGSNQNAGEDDLTVLRPSVLPVDSVSPTGRPRKVILLVDGATGVTVANLTIDGSAAFAGATLKFPNCNALGFNVGIYYRNSSGTVASTHTTNIRSVVHCSAGIFAESGPGGAANVTVNDNTVDNYGHVGVVCNGASTALTVTRNTLLGRGPVDDETQIGIENRAGCVAQVRLNSVSRHLCTDPSCGPDINAFQAFGIFVLFGGSGSHISENRVADNDLGILQFESSDCCTISENHLTNNRFFGIAFQDGNGTTAQNQIMGGNIGIAVLADSVDTVVVLHEDNIHATVAPVREFSFNGFTATAIIK